MRAVAAILGLIAIVTTGCGDVAIDRIRESEDGSTNPAPASAPRPSPSSPSTQPNSLAPDSVASLNGRALSVEDLGLIESAYDLQIGTGDFWYDPVSGAWGYWGGPTMGFLASNMELGHPPIEASGGGTGVVLNGRELHPIDLGGLQQLLGYVYPGYYWLNSNGDFGVEGGQALGNLIYVAQRSGSNSGGAYYDSTYFGNVGSDGQNSYFYDSDSGCSVMSDGGLSC